LRLQVINLGIGHLEVERCTCRDPLRNEVFNHLGLRVDRDGPSAGQLAEVDMVPLTGELQVDAAVLEPLAIEPVGESGLAEQPHAPVLDPPGPLPRRAVGTAADLDHDGIDSAERKQMRQQQPGRACPDNAYLRAHLLIAVLTAAANTAETAFVRFTHSSSVI